MDWARESTPQCIYLFFLHNIIKWPFVCAHIAVNQFPVLFQEFSSSTKCTSVKGLRRAGHLTSRRLGPGPCKGVEPRPWSSTLPMQEKHLEWMPTTAGEHPRQFGQCGTVQIETMAVFTCYKVAVTQIWLSALIWNRSDALIPKQCII